MDLAGIQAATQRKRFATAIGFGISLNLARAGQAQARSRSVRKAHGQGRHGRREVLSIGVVTPLVVPLAAKAEAEPPTVSKKVSEGVYIFDQAYGIPGLGVGRCLGRRKLQEWASKPQLPDLRCQYSHPHDRAEP